MTITTLWMEHALWGLVPLAYHLVNILMHGACVILLWRVLRSLRVQGAWLGAALWALHPVEVESVAWITEMKNTESDLGLIFFQNGQLEDAITQFQEALRLNPDLSPVRELLAKAQASLREEHQ